MSSRDHSLFTAPRASHFDLLMSDDDHSDNDSIKAEAHNEQDSATPEKKKSFENHTVIERASQEPLVESDGWSCAAPKAHRKPTAARTGSNTRPGQAGKKTGPSPPLAIEQLSPELTIEIYDFPAAWRTPDIRKFMIPFDHQYRLKWQNDTSCFIHFETSELASRALQELHSDIASLRAFALENVVQQTPKTDLVPTPQNTVEVYGFPATWRSNELNKCLSDFAGHYRLKWRNDASCYVIFESTELLEDAKRKLSNESSVKVRPYCMEPNADASAHSPAKQH